MNRSHSEDYFERRAEEERAACKSATNVRAAKSHRELAKLYRKRALDRGSAGDGQAKPAGIQSTNFWIVS